MARGAPDRNFVPRRLRLGLAAVLVAGLLAGVPPLFHALEISPARALREL